MTEHPHPVVLALGANLRDARERRYILLEQAAELLDVAPETCCAIEAGHLAITPADIHRLCDLYGTEDAHALGKMAAVECGDCVPTGEAWPGGPNGSRPLPVRDDHEGHGRRLAAVFRQAARVRWVSTVLVPPPLQTPEYATMLHQPPAALSGAPLAVVPEQTFVLDENAVLRDGDRPGVMARQVAHLAKLRAHGANIHFVHDVFPPGSVAELTMTAGTVLVNGWEPPVYQAGTAQALNIDAAVAVANSAASRSARLLEGALARHRVAHAPAATGPS